jgi:hypothetical protein
VITMTPRPRGGVRRPQGVPVRGLLAECGSQPSAFVDKATSGHLQFLHIPAKWHLAGTRNTFGSA